MAQRERALYLVLRKRSCLKRKNLVSELKVKDSEDYYHLASAEDDLTVKTLGERDFFSSYTKRTEAMSGGEVEVLPLEIIGETKWTVHP